MPDALSQAPTLPRYMALLDRARAAGAEHLWWRTLSTSVGLAVMIVGGAFALGRIVGGLWGV